MRRIAVRQLRQHERIRCAGGCAQIGIGQGAGVTALLDVTAFGRSILALVTQEPNDEHDPFQHPCQPAAPEADQRHDHAALLGADPNARSSWEWLTSLLLAAQNWYFKPAEIRCLSDV